MSNLRTLRSRLRQELREDHDRLDGLMSQADLTTVDGLRRFLAAQSFGFRAIATRLDPQDTPETARLVDELIRALDDDLGRLGVPDTSGGVTADGTGLSGVAIDYLVLGSGLGAAVLRQRWATAEDDEVRAAGRFISFPRPADDWATLKGDLQARPAEGAQADRITADAARIFGFFEEGWVRSATLNTPELQSAGKVEP